jgi:hypothetical protein
MNKKNLLKGCINAYNGKGNIKPCLKKPYFLRYTNINLNTIKLVKTLKEEGYFKANEEIKRKMLNNLIFNLADIYKIKINGFYFTDNKIYNDSRYNQLNNTIYLNKASIVTALHEFKHALQHNKHKLNNEDIARSWSLSLFYIAYPNIFKSSVKKGLILFVNSEDFN